MNQLVYSKSAKTQRETLLSIIIFTILILLISHGTINTLVQNILINSITLILISLILNLFLIGNKLYFSFVMIIYVCSHFQYASVYGGTFVLTSFLVLLPQFFKNNISELKISDRLITILIFLLFINTVLGWIFKNNMPITQLSAGIFTFFGYLFIFVFSSRIYFDTNKIKILIHTFILLLVYSFIFSMNTYFDIININSPLINFPMQRTGVIYLSGTIGHTELFGEYSMVMYLILFPLLFSDFTKNRFNISRRWIIVGLITALVNIFISRSRSTIALVSIGTLVELIFIWFFSNHKIFNRKSKLFSNSIIIISIITILWGPLNLTYVLQRFTNPDIAYPIITDKQINLLTGEGTPRGLAFSYFFMRLPEESWWIGYGWGVPKSNRIAWFKNPDISRSDYHSLYLSLPMLYGWIGSVAFISLIIITIIRLKKTIQKSNRNTIHYLLQVGFFFALSFLMINEYKISLLRNETYHMMFWIWLGISNALIYSSSYTNKQGNFY